MMYPFLMVTLYSVMEILKNEKGEEYPRDFKAPDERTTPFRKKMLRFVDLLLDWGLPALSFMFFCLFWCLGLTSQSEKKFCKSGG